MNKVTPIGVKTSTALKSTLPNYSQIPEIGFLKLSSIVGDKKKGIPAILPVGKSTFLKRVAEGIYPAAVKLGGSRSVAWRVEDIRALIDSLGGV
jgi:predicted DNA-binding transcriptional regulator AlpA